MREALHIARRVPGGAYRRLRLLAGNGKLRRARVAWLTDLLETSPTAVEAAIEEIEHDHLFIAEMRAAFRAQTSHIPLPTDFMTTPSGNTQFFHCVSLYAAMRLLRPQVVVETGGTPGKSSAFILRALARNESGELYTIDLPPTQPSVMKIPVDAVTSLMPIGAGSGWAIPDSLKRRHQVRLGDARQRLPEVIAEVGQMEVFIHDSDHSYDHMRWEFEVAWPALKPRGLLWSDDTPTNSAWQDFCTSLDIAGSTFTSQGAARKPD
jgi:hypothetical protein